MSDETVGGRDRLVETAGIRTKQWNVLFLCQLTKLQRLVKLSHGMARHADQWPAQG